MVAYETSSLPPLPPQNYARLQARTPMVAYVDVDSVVSSGLSSVSPLPAWPLHVVGAVPQNGGVPPPPTSTNASGTDSRHIAWVLPAFYVR